jgi:hypothetical protein
MADMKSLAVGAEHILRDIQFLPGDGYGGCQSKHGLAHIFGKYQKRKHTQSHKRRRDLWARHRRTATRDRISKVLEMKATSVVYGTAYGVGRLKKQNSKLITNE